MAHERPAEPDTEREKPSVYEHECNFSLVIRRTSYGELRRCDSCQNTFFVHFGVPDRV